MNDKPLWIFMHTSLIYDNRPQAFGHLGKLPEHITHELIEAASPVGNAYLLFTELCPYKIEPRRKETKLTYEGCFWLWPGTYYQHEGGSIDIFVDPYQYQRIVDRLLYSINDAMKIAKRVVDYIPPEEEWDEELSADMFLLGKIKKFL